MEALENITANSKDFDSVEVSVSAEVLITTSEEVVGDEEVHVMLSLQGRQNDSSSFMIDNYKRHAS